MTETLTSDLPLTAMTITSLHRQNEIPVLEALGLLLKRKGLIAITAGAVTCLSITAWIWAGPKYKAEASILPPQQVQSSLAALASGALGGLGGGAMGASLGLKNPADLYVGILKSRTIADRIIARFDLQHVYRKKLLSDVRKKLAANVNFSAGKESIITITASDHDAPRAAAIANAYIDELYKQNSRLALSDASQRRLFFGQQLEQEKNALGSAEVDLKATQQSTGLLAPGGQAEVLIRSGAELRAQIASRQVHLQAMRSYATDQNPQVLVIQRELAALQTELSRVESNNSGSKLEVTGGRLPEASLEYIRKLRDVKYHETLFELLAKQFEAARLDEAKQAPVIQVVDRASVPDRSSNASLSVVIVGSLLGGCILGCAIVIAIERIKRFRQYLASATGPASFANSIGALNERVSQ